MGCVKVFEWIEYTATHRIYIYCCSPPLSSSLALSLLYLLLFLLLTLITEGAARVLGRVGGIQDLLMAMRSFPNNLAIVASCCAAFWDSQTLVSRIRCHDDVTNHQGLFLLCIVPSLMVM